MQVSFGGTLGDGEPVLHLDTTPFELLRMVFGRRSQAQLESAAWSGPGTAADRAAAVDAIHLFDCPPADVDDGVATIA